MFKFLKTGTLFFVACRIKAFKEQINFLINLKAIHNKAL